MKAWMTSSVSSCGSGFTAICCLGKPAFIGALSVLGLGARVNDAVLIPAMILYRDRAPGKPRLLDPTQKKQAVGLAGISAVLIIAGLWTSGWLVGTGIAGMFMASGLEFYFSRKMRGHLERRGVT